MMKTTKIISILLAMLLICSMFAACGRSAPDTGAGGGETTVAQQVTEKEPADDITTKADAGNVDNAVDAADASNAQEAEKGTEAQNAAGDAKEADNGAVDANGAENANAAETTTEPTTASTRDTIIMQVFSMTCNKSGLMDNTYWTEILERDLGIKLEIMPAGDSAEQKLAVLMASGSFPDLVGLSTHKQVIDAIDAKMLLRLDDYQAQLPDVFANIPNGLNYYRDNVSNGTGELYALPVLTSTVSMQVEDFWFCPFVRWDLYKQLGSPTMQVWEDFIPLLEQMVALEPNNPEGQKNYAYGIFPDWDYYGIWIPDMMTNIYGASGSGFLEINFIDNSTTSKFDETSNYKRWLDFTFELNQRGLLDPDSLTQRYDDYLDKIRAGRYMFGEGNWYGNEYNNAERWAEGRSIEMLPVQDMKAEGGQGPNYIGHTGGWSWAIGTNCKYFDRALEYTNYMFSYDGMWKMAHGEQGVYWDLDPNGVPYVTEAGNIKKARQFEFPNGGEHEDGLATLNNYAFDTREIHPVYGVPFNSDAWPRTEFSPPIDPWRVAWNDDVGLEQGRGTIPWLTEQGFMIERDFAPMPAVAEEIDQIEARVADMCRTQSWLMIYAADRAEYDALWEDMVNRAKDMNVDAANADRARLYHEALTFGSKYMG